MKYCIVCIDRLDRKNIDFYFYNDIEIALTEIKSFYTDIDYKQFNILLLRHDEVLQFLIDNNYVVTQQTIKDFETFADIDRHFTEQ